MRQLLMLERGCSETTKDMLFPKGIVSVELETKDFYFVKRDGFFGPKFQWLPKDGIIIKFQEIHMPGELKP